MLPALQLRSRGRGGQSRPALCGLPFWPRARRPPAPGEFPEVGREQWEEMQREGRPHPCQPRHLRRLVDLGQEGPLVISSLNVLPDLEMPLPPTPATGLGTSPLEELGGRHQPPRPWEESLEAAQQAGCPQA